MRGKVVRLFDNRKSSGITPAYAGKRQYKELLQQYNKDHPRLCGEKAIKSASHSFIAGSPPPMRGKAF